MALILADRVMETASTTGTGAFTLAGAYTGYRAFSAVLSTNDTCRYCIVRVDVNGNDTAEWEVGLGTYSGVNTLTRTTVEASSNAGLAVSFAAGNKRVFIGASAAYFPAVFMQKTNNLSDVASVPTARDNIGAAPKVLTIEVVAGTTYTFATADSHKHKRFTSSSAVAATVPPNASDPIAIGTRIRNTVAGTGQVTLTPGAAVTLNSRDGALKSAGQYAVFEIEKVGTDEWDVLGDLTA